MITINVVPTDTPEEDVENGYETYSINNVLHRSVEPVKCVKIDPNTWTHKLKIHVLGSQEQYDQLLDDWFDCLADKHTEDLYEMFRESVSLGFNLQKEIKGAKQWLKDATKSARKTDIYGFLFKNSRNIKSKGYIKRQAHFLLMSKDTNYRRDVYGKQEDLQY